MQEFEVVYTVDGKGYTKDLPWLDSRHTDEKAAQQAAETLNDWFIYRNYLSHNIWINVRNVTEWVPLEPKVD